MKRAPETKFGDPCSPACRSSKTSTAAHGSVGPGDYPLAADPGKEKGPSYSFGRIDGISPETYAKSKLGKLKDRAARPKRCGSNHDFTLIASFIDLAAHLIEYHLFEDITNCVGRCLCSPAAFSVAIVALSKGHLQLLTTAGQRSDGEHTA
jgi:hypothetical protein